MPAVLQLTDGTTTIDLISGSTYALTEGGWAPSVTPIDEGVLGGRSPYGIVSESIRINVYGATQPAIYAALNAVATLLLAARQWARTGEGAPVRLRYQPLGSALAAPIEATVLGQAGPPLELPASYHDYQMVREVAEVTLAFERREFVGAAEAVSSAAGTASALLQATFASTVALPAPTSVRLGGFANPPNGSGSGRGILIVANAARRIAVLDPQAYDAGGGSNNVSPDGVLKIVADTGRFASNGSVLRIGSTTVAIVSDAPYNTYPYYPNFSLPGTYTGRSTAVFAVIRRESLSSELFASVQAIGLTLFDSPSAGDDFVTTRGVRGEAVPVATPAENSAFAPAVYPLGILTTAAPLTSIQLAVTLSGPGQFLDIDLLVAVDLDAGGDAHLLQILPDGVFPYAWPSVIVGSGGQVLVDPDPLARHEPFVGQRRSTDGLELSVGRRGNAAIYLRGAGVACCWLATGVNYRPTSALTLTATRRPVYLTPE